VIKLFIIFKTANPNRYISAVFFVVNQFITPYLHMYINLLLPNMKVFNVKLPLFKGIETFQINNNPLLFHITILSNIPLHNCVQNRPDVLGQQVFLVQNRSVNKRVLSARKRSGSGRCFLRESEAAAADVFCAKAKRQRQMFFVRKRSANVAAAATT